MYAQYTRRRPVDLSCELEVFQHAKAFFPKLQQAPGFVSLTVIECEDGSRRGMYLWESRAAAEAFQSEFDRWEQLLDRVGPLEDHGRGEVFQHLTPPKPVTVG